MIPVFPKFKKISRNDRELLLSYIGKFLPYSDYNFNSLWAWDTDGNMKFSDLNGNLVVTMPDYTTSEPLLSFIGINELESTVHELLDHRVTEGLANELKLIPEIAINRISNQEFQIDEDRDHFDYVFSTKKLAQLKGRSFKAKRQLANTFMRNYPETAFEVGLISDKQRNQEILTVLENWKNSKNDLNTKLETKAIKRLLGVAKNGKNELIFTGAYLDSELLAFSIDEILNYGYALSHFYKIKSQFKGVSEYINQQTASFLHNKGVELWSWEQDLGIEGLRKSKMSYRPVHFLKKYKITKK